MKPNATTPRGLLYPSTAKRKVWGLRDYAEPSECRVFKDGKLIRVEPAYLPIKARGKKNNG